MLTGLSDDPKGISDSRKTAVINDKLKRLHVDIATLQETRLPDSGSPKEKDYTFFGQRKNSNEPHQHGVGFAVRNSLLNTIEPGSNGFERLLTLRLNTTAGPITLISVYAPTLSATPDDKDEFYDRLAATISSIPSKEEVVLLGDFNARVGCNHDSRPSCLRQFGVGKMNDNGQRLLELCTYHNLCIANSFFKTKPQHKVSWRHPRSKHWHQLDLILVRRTAIKNVLLTRSYHSVDCDTDHFLVCCKIKLQRKRYHCSKKQGYLRIDVSKMSQPDLVEQFARRFESELKTSQTGDSAMEKWDTLRDAIHRTALAMFERKTLKSHDWFEGKSAEMTPVIKAKRAAVAEYKRSPSERNLQIVRAARSKAQHTARHYATEYWSELSETIQTAAIIGNIRGMYNGIRTAMGPAQNKTAPLKSITGEVITDKGKQMERWVEHYSDLYCRQNVVTTAALDAIDCVPAIEELDIEPTIEKLNKAINSLASGKAPGSDGIPPDLIKHCVTTLLLPLHEVLCQCWKEGILSRGYSLEIWVRVCSPPLETLTLFQTKICDFPHPISDLTQNFIPYFRPDPYPILFA